VKQIEAKKKVVKSNNMMLQANAKTISLSTNKDTATDIL